LLKTLGAEESDISEMRKRELKRGIEREATISMLEAEIAEREHEIAACVMMREQTLERMRLEHQQKLEQRIAALNANSISRVEAQRQKQAKKDFMSFFTAPLTFWKFSCCHNDRLDEGEFEAA
jgi:hypothetical protein